MFEKKRMCPMKTKTNRFIALTSFALLAAAAPLFASETDSRIEAAAKNSYIFQTFLKDDSIKTQSKEGVVTLSGTVLHESHKDMARIVVANLPGVQSVDNQLQFKGVSPGVNSDEYLSMQVLLALWLNRDIGDSKPQVTVEQGVAILRGEVKNEEQQTRIAEYARDVKGIKGVRNEMTIAPATGVPTPTKQEQVDDASITAAVMMALLTRQSTSELKTSVSTQDGIVTVDGAANNPAEKETVTKLVSDTYGVRGVINNMTF